MYGIKWYYKIFTKIGNTKWTLKDTIYTKWKDIDLQKPNFWSQITI